MPTRAAPPLPPSANNRQPAGVPKSGIPSVNRNTAWVDPNAVDPLQQSPIIKNDSGSDEESEDEDEEGMSANDKRGKKRVRSERTCSGGGSSDKRAARREMNGVAGASLSDWEIVETLGKLDGRYEAFIAERLYHEVPGPSVGSCSFACGRIIALFHITRYSPSFSSR